MSTNSAPGQAKKKASELRLIVVISFSFDLEMVALS